MKLSMNLYRHRNGTWYIRIGRSDQHPHGRLVSLKTKEETEARRIFNEVKRKHLEDRIVRLSGETRLKISQLAEAFATDPDRAGLSADTHRMDRLALKMLSDTIGDKLIRLITEQDLKRFKASLASRGLSTATVNTYRRHIMAALNWAVDSGQLKKLPRFKPASDGTLKRLPKFFTPAELSAVLAKAKDHDYEIYRLAVFALWTGCRLQECLAAEWQNFDGSSIKICGKGGKERVVPVMPAALEVMGDRRDIGRIFAKLHPDTVSHRFSAIAVSAGCAKTFHGLRHSAATYMLKSGIPLAVVQKVLGHADIRTTQIYAKVCDEMVRAEMAKLHFANS